MTISKKYFSWFASFCLGSLLLLSFLPEHYFAVINLLDPDHINASPSLSFPFGSDWLGRNVFLRTILGLSNSLKIGLFASLISSSIACALGILSGFYPQTIGKVTSFIVDLFLALPHLVLLIFIAFILGGGSHGVIYAIALTHWPTLSRLLESEVKQIKNASFLQASCKLGKSHWWQIRHHLFPLLLPQLRVGFLILFPKAILHEAGLTFLGFGLPPHIASIGTMLSESMIYLNAGLWWTIIFPGISLFLLVNLFASLIGKRILYD